MQDDIKSGILVHVCCGFCGFSALRELKGDFKITFFWYNPNIYPADEHLKRQDAIKKLALMENIEMNEMSCDAKNWFEKTGKIKDNEEQRCETCYRMRLEAAVKTTQEKGIRHFTTTLLISPFQKHEKIRTVCIELSEKYGVEFFYYDARKKYYENRDAYRKLGLYFQKYCGCIYSKIKREQEGTKNKSENK